MMAHSIDLMPTGSSLMPSTQAPSQGAGQTRPVNSGKLLVIKSRLSASCHSPLKTTQSVSTGRAWRWAPHAPKSFHLGMMLEIGQPVSLWQNGTPQSMHRAAWYLS
jgi:hypothetical protein